MMKRAIILVCLLLLMFTTVYGQEQDRKLGFGQQFSLKDLPKNINPLDLFNPVDYHCTPGDLYTLQIIVDFQRHFSYPLNLEDNYKLSVPYIGTIDVKGMTFAEMRKKVVNGIRSRVPLQYVDIALKVPAHYDVFIYGGVNRPGFVSVIPINRVADAIVLAGGLKKGASFRQIQLIRDGKITKLDLSDYVVNADLSQNPYLKRGDKLYIPYAEIIVHLKGAVKFDGFYEMVPGETLQDLLDYAGGTLPNALTSKIEILQIAKEGKYAIKTVSIDQAKAVALNNGDLITIHSSYESSEMIMAEGALFGLPIKEGEPIRLMVKPILINVPYFPGISVLTLLDNLGGPTPFARAKDSYIIRKSQDDKIPVDVEKLWRTRDEKYDLALKPGDHLVVPIMILKVFVAGEVRSPGEKNFLSGLTVSDYLLAAGGITEDGDPHGVFLLFRDGSMQKIALTQEVGPGAVLFVDKNGLAKTTDTLTKLGIIVGFASSILILGDHIYDTILKFR
ncbi:MAG: SLBB domain-containing protein [Spirochaetia bacterium]